MAFLPPKKPAPKLTDMVADEMRVRAARLAMFAKLMEEALDG